ncbi:long-chain-acyl-CoA synthetase [Porticoccaceae bacterium]|nr:long-chain-acyl-CoA synthetase [Porticoccaceae bacterium]
MISLREVLRVLVDFAKLVPVMAVKPPQPKVAVSVASIFEATAARYADRNMIIFEQQELTWREFNELANRMARALMDGGVKRGDSIALIMENRVEMLAYTVAMQKLGVITAFVNPALSGTQLAHCLSTAKAVKCVVGEEVFANLDAIRVDIGLADEDILWIADQRTTAVPEGLENALSQLDGYACDNLADTCEILAGDMAFYIFTSGTTGLPKAAKISHRRWMSGAYPYSKVGCRAKASDRFYICLPLYHATGFICGVGSCFYSGASIFLRRKFSGSAFWSDVQRHSITNFIYVGELCRYLLAQPPCPEERNNSLDRVFGNGLRPDIWMDFKERFGISRVCEFYGSSEGNIGFVNGLNKDRTMGICGANILLVEYDIDADEMVRDEHGKVVEVSVGEPGLLLGEIDDRYKFDGYTNDSASESKILRDLVKPGDAWFNTGDLICQVDVGFAMGLAHYQFVDRVGDTFRWRSENVSTNEVGEIINANRQVEMANVYGVDIPAADGKAGMVSLVLKDQETFDAEEFSAYVTSNLPIYAQPVFVRIQREVATTGTFKLVKGDLRKQAYHMDRVSDQLYYLPPREQRYRVFDQGVYQSVIDGTAGY